MIKYSYNILVGGIPIRLKNRGVKVSWDDEIPNIFPLYSQYMDIYYIYGLFLWCFYGFPMESHNPFMFQTTNQHIISKQLQ